jgi:hypothetical protein
MSRRLTPIVLLATLTTAAVWDAAAFAQVIPGAWSGSAKCTAHATSSTKSYQNDETHTWKIVIPQVITSSGSIPLYAENWTVTGGGGNDQNSWMTDGGRPGGQLEFRIATSDNMLHIQRFTDGKTDPQGTKVTPKNGVNSFFTAVGEIAFPDIPLADPNSTSIKGSSTSTTLNTTGGFFLAPDDSTVVTTCS